MQLGGARRKQQVPSTCLLRQIAGKEVNGSQISVKSLKSVLVKRLVESKWPICCANNYRRDIQTLIGRSIYNIQIATYSF